MTRPRLGDDRGSVVAEFAVALPAIVLVLLLGAGVLAAGARHVRLQDAAADAARLAARGQPDRAGDVIALAVPGATVIIEPRGDLVCAIAAMPAMMGVELRATGCALAGGL